MTLVSIRLVTRNYDMLGPLVAGDVVPDGIELTLDREAAIGTFPQNAALQAGEMSFSGYLRRIAAGADTIVALPIVLMRGYRQRCFFTRRGSGLSSLADLAGKRVGTNGWPDTGNTWSRLALLDAGVSLDSMSWWVGTIDGATDELFGHRASLAGLPERVTPVPTGQSLVEMLLSGRLDALMIPWPPRGFYATDSPIVRLVPDYRMVEQAYGRRVRYCPGHHILGVRADLLQRHPEVARTLFEAFEASRRQAEERRLNLADTSPWVLADLEETATMLGADWQAHGVAPNRAMIGALAETMHTQGIVERALEVDDVFAGFERLLG